MKMQVYSVYDKSVGAFNSPFFVRSKGEALRGFTELSNDAQTMPGKYPADFTLFEIGVYDDQSGLIECHEPSRVISALELVREPEVTAPQDIREAERMFGKRVPM